MKFTSTVALMACMLAASGLRVEAKRRLGRGCPRFMRCAGEVIGKKQWRNIPNCYQPICAKRVKPKLASRSLRLKAEYDEADFDEENVGSCITFVNNRVTRVPCWDSRGNPYDSGYDEDDFEDEETGWRHTAPNWRIDRHFVPTVDGPACRHCADSRRGTYRRGTYFR